MLGWPKGPSLFQFRGGKGGVPCERGEDFHSFSGLKVDVNSYLWGGAVARLLLAAHLRLAGHAHQGGRCMAGRSANDQTIIKLYAAYSRQRMSRQKAIMLIAASLGIYQKDVLAALERKGL